MLQGPTTVPPRFGFDLGILSGIFRGLHSDLGWKTLVVGLPECLTLRFVIANIPGA